MSYNAADTGAWDTDIEIPLDERGYPLQIPYNNGVDPPQIVRTTLLIFKEYLIPKGQYRLIVEGTGLIELEWGASGTYECPVDTFVNVTNSLAIKILRSDSTDHISDIKLILPKYTETYQDKKFTDEFLSFLDDFHVIRFMEATRTNNSDVETWDQRGQYDYFTQSQSEGLAWEYVIELCNITQKDAWINIPHKADDNYILQLATLFHEQLDGNINIYIEYSNEVWHPNLDQHYYAADMAEKLGYSGDTAERACKYTAKRSADIFDIFETVFTDDSRIIKVLCGISVYSAYSHQLINYFNDPHYNPQGISADALGIAPYFGFNVLSNIVYENVVETITIEEILDRLEARLEVVYKQIRDNKSVADNNSLVLLSYEGGQHMKPEEEYLNNEVLMQKLFAANRHPRMQDIYCQYLNYWYENAGELFMPYTSNSTCGYQGCFGLKEGMFDYDNPKYQAFQECVFSYNNKGDNLAPVFNSITRQPPINQYSDADSLTFRITLNEDVKHVSSDDFIVTGTTATITDISANVGHSVYDITVSGGDLANISNTVGVKFAESQDITDLAGNALPFSEPTINETYIHVQKISPTVYYMSSNGNDENIGTSPELAWQTINRVNLAELKPGDSVLFQRGDIFRGNLIPQSGSTTSHITYGAYGSGEEPRILGSIQRNDVSDWELLSDNIWQTTSNQVIVSDKELLHNPNFATNLSSWYIVPGKTPEVSANMYRTTEPGEYLSDSAAVKIYCEKTGESPSQIQFWTAPYSIKEGTWYRFSFWAKASREFQIPDKNIWLMERISPYTKYSFNYNTIYIGTQWKKYEILFKSTESSNNASIRFFLASHIPDDTYLYIDSCSFIELENDPRPLKNEIGNIIFNDEAFCSVKKNNIATL